MKSSKHTGQRCDYGVWAGVGCPAVRVARLPMAHGRRCRGAVADAHSVAAGAAAVAAAGAAAESAQRWRDVRAVLTANRHELGRVAAGLYPDLPRAGSADLLCRPQWLPPAPLGLDDLPVIWDGGPTDGRPDGGPPDGGPPGGAPPAEALPDGAPPAGDRGTVRP